MEQFKRTFGASGRIFRGEIILAFFDRREIKEWAGLVTRTENFYFERWHLPISVIPSSNSSLNTPIPSNASLPNRRHSTGSAELHAAAGWTGGAEGGDVDYNEGYRLAYDQVTKVIMTVLEVSYCVDFYGVYIVFAVIGMVIWEEIALERVFLLILAHFLKRILF